MGAKFEFDKKEGVKATRVNLYCDTEGDILSISEKERDFLIDWSIEWLSKFKNTLHTIIQEID